MLLGSCWRTTLISLATDRFQGTSQGRPCETTEERVTKAVWRLLRGDPGEARRFVVVTWN